MSSFFGFHLILSKSGHKVVADIHDWVGRCCSIIPAVFLKTNVGPAPDNSLWPHFLSEPICLTSLALSSVAPSSHYRGQRSLLQPANFSSTVKARSRCVAAKCRVVQRDLSRSLRLDAARLSSAQLNSCDLCSRPEQCTAFTHCVHTYAPHPSNEK